MSEILDKSLVKLIEDNAHLLKESPPKYEEFYNCIPIEMRGSVSTFLFNECGINPLFHMRLIPKKCFYNSFVAGITIPNNIESIGEDAFFMSDVNKIKIPKSVRSIEYGAFFRCDLLKELSIEEGVKTIGNYAFSYTDIEKVNIPDSVEEIDESAFSKCFKLKELTLGKGIKRIGNHAFFRSSVYVVSYNGTVEDWSHVHKGLYMFGTNTFIECTDGGIKYEV